MTDLHISSGLPQLHIKSLRTSDAYMRQRLATISSDSGLSPRQRQAIIWTNAGILLIRT